MNIYLSLAFLVILILPHNNVYSTDHQNNLKACIACRMANVPCLFAPSNSSPCQHCRRNGSTCFFGLGRVLRQALIACESCYEKRRACDDRNTCGRCEKKRIECVRRAKRRRLLPELEKGDAGSFVTNIIEQSSSFPSPTDPDEDSWLPFTLNYALQDFH